MFVNHFISEHWDQETVVHELGISTRTAVDWRSFSSEVTDHWFSHPPGGPNIVVEIDETVICRRKYNRGRQVSSIWLFGGIERVSKKRFVVPLTGDRGENRDRATLWPIIREYILPGSIIYSDCWKAYDGLDIPDLWEQFGVDPNYTHHTVNHSANFVDSKSSSPHPEH